MSVASALSASFAPTIAWNATAMGPFATEPAVLGATRLQRYAYDGGVNLGERAAFVACVARCSYTLDETRSGRVTAVVTRH